MCVCGPVDNPLGAISLSLRNTDVRPSRFDESTRLLRRYEKWGGATIHNRAHACARERTSHHLARLITREILKATSLATSSRAPSASSLGSLEVYGLPNFYGLACFTGDLLLGIMRDVSLTMCSSRTDVQRQFSARATNYELVNMRWGCSTAS